MIKNQKGFTLVEVIVVAVIVAVLAAVAIPLYNGYIHDSRVNVANNTAASVAGAAVATIQQDPALLPVDGEYAAGAIITFSGADPNNQVDNTFVVPPDYTVTIADPVVRCASTKDVTAVSSDHAFR